MTTESTPANLLTPSEVCEMLRISEITLKRWRAEGKGPKPYYLSARSVRYKRADVSEWLANNGAGEPRD